MQILFGFLLSQAPHQWKEDAPTIKCLHKLNKWKSIEILLLFFKKINSLELKYWSKPSKSLDQIKKTGLLVFFLK